MQSDSSARKNPTHRRTTSLLSRPRHALLDFPNTPSGVSTPASLETNVAYGAFTPTYSVFPCLTSLMRSNSAFLPATYSRRRHHSMFEWPDKDSDTGCSDTSSVPASPTSSFRSPFAPTVPRITRTSSYDTHSSGSSSPSEESSYATRGKRTEMNHILSELERKSKLCTTLVGCATCGKLGSDYPRCGRCGEMWCSRPCRLRGGKRHICALKPA
ncbi:hypothetical protein GYMLUDRAFT_33927 [Collybiopsis luxurians FD-317 M1]|nr:hypothetical protein GYMLUDRAFT_33927 [Collybiopsis luxurians FD-317 M1]